jgi:hypothetical protein
MAPIKSTKAQRRQIGIVQKKVVITIFSDFFPTFGEKMALFFETNDRIIFSKLSVF